VCTYVCMIRTKKRERERDRDFAWYWSRKNKAD